MDQTFITQLRQELDRWTAAPAVFWWRDDDATEPSSSLHKLARLSEKHDFPCALAVIPARTSHPLADQLQRHPLLGVIQHGYDHRNHAPKGVGAWELGLHRPVETVLTELRRGRRNLAALFGPRFVPVMVPPWNRIDPALAASLPEAGFRGLSADAEGKELSMIPGLFQAHAHADLLRWKKGPATFAGAEKVIAPLLRELERQRRSGDKRPVGILTHHLEMDDAAWRFLDTLLDTLSRHPAARPASAATIWQETL